MEQSAIKAFGDYLKAIQKDLSAGNATERTHYTALKTLLESLRLGIRATAEPRRRDCGAPDFIVTRDNNIPLGYVEAKDVGTNLREAEKTDQLKRYFQSLSNLILTDYTTFRLYREGVFVERGKVGIRCARWQTYRRFGRHRKDLQSDSRLSGERIPDSRHTQRTRGGHGASGTPFAATLSSKLSITKTRTARCIRNSKPSATTSSPISSLRSSPTCTRKRSPTVCSRRECECAVAADFSRKGAAYLIPKTNPFLREFFDQVAGPNLDDRIEWVVEDLVQLLRRADIAQILSDFGRRTRREDPVVHFYETFLQAYDPKIREMRGVYYTPEPAVNYIVRAIDEKLKTEFDRPDGLADPNVYILDPACGTSTFLYATVKHIYEHLQSYGTRPERGTITSRSIFFRDYSASSC